MRALSAAELLTVWERGAGQTPAQRALGLLVAASPDASPDCLARFTIGQRDESLLTLRAWLFGARMTGLTQCPQCGEQVEITLDTRDFLAAHETSGQEEHALGFEGYQVRFRLPTSADLLALEFGDSAVARPRLIDRCLLAVELDGARLIPANLPESVVDQVVAKMSRVDPLGNIQLELSCPSCRHGWKALFDIVSFLWSEINAWAHRVLREVHSLATAYGWSEADILSMSAWRRQLYLQMAAS